MPLKPKKKKMSNISLVDKHPLNIFRYLNMNAIVAVIKTTTKKKKKEKEKR